MVELWSGESAWDSEVVPQAEDTGNGGCHR